MIVSPSLLKNRSFIQASTRPMDQSKENNISHRPSEGVLSGLYKLAEGNSYDSFEDRSD